MAGLFFILAKSKNKVFFQFSFDFYQRQKYNNKRNKNFMDTNKEDILDKKLDDLEEQRKEEEVKNQAANTGWPYINLKGFPISQEAIKVIKPEQAKALQTVCFLYSNEELRLASTNPDNPQLGQIKKELEDKYHAHLKIYLTSQASLNIALEIYDKIPVIEHIEGVHISAENLEEFNKSLSDLKALQGLLQQTNVTEMISLVIAAGLKFNASDIHIETEEQEIKIRLRIDGVLQQAASITSDNWHKISSRIKLLADLKLNVTTQPQDGRFTINLSSDKIDVRVSTIPSTYGESIVLRLLRASSVGLKFEELGLRGKAYNDLANEISKPNGMIITTGPTGSGKTTTLYAVLNRLNKPETKIITLEDPIEYKLPGIVQSQVDNTDAENNEATSSTDGLKKNRYTFAKGLRAILRQDPDIVMVGEIRDLETADTAINAALTGHLMLSTLHTNSAAGTIPRLLAMGVQPFLLAPSLNAVIGQRLVRKLCQDCKQETEIDNKTLTLVLNALNSISPQSGAKPDNTSNLKFFTAKGCEKCGQLGYKGRIGIYEIFNMNQKIEKIILSANISEYDIEKIAIEEGMVTMLQDGILKALDGITSLDEVLEKTKA